MRSANSKKLNFCGLDVRSDPIKVDCNENCIFLREFFNVLQPFFKDLKFIFCHMDKCNFYRWLKSIFMYILYLIGIDGFSEMAFFAKWNMKWVTVVTISKKRPQRSSVVLNEASWHTLPLLLFRISLLLPLVWNWLFVAWFFILYPNVLSTFDKWLLGCPLIKNQKRMGIKERQKY